MSRELFKPAAVVFIASFCTLVIELVAGRIMAPYVGVSLYTWTSIIGVVLAGISAGAWLGGIAADRFPRPSLLGWLLLASGVAALAIAPLVDLIGSEALLSGRFTSTLMTRVLMLSAFVFFVPSLLLGMISPVVVKLTLKSLDTTGIVVGKIYAFSTFGSILGTFATGFFLIDWFGTRAILATNGAMLILAAFAFGSLVRGRAGTAAVTGTLLALFVLAVFQRDTLANGYRTTFRPPSKDADFFKESNYFTIRVSERTRADGAGTLQTLSLDHLVHSLNDLDDPSFLAYRYLRIVHELILQRLAVHPQPRLRILFLGGGGYTLPRFLEQAYPGLLIDVVEIDPAVTDVARSRLGFVPSDRLRSFNQDARWFLMRSAGKYDVIVCDAFADISVPYHLTTIEFVRLLHDRLNPDGIVAANVIDNFQQGEFLPSFLVTVQSVFGRGRAVLLSDHPDYDSDAQSTFIIAATNGDAATLLPLHSTEEVARVPDAELREFLLTRKPVLLTDDHAPVDNLLAPLFEQRFEYERGR